MSSEDEKVEELASKIFHEFMREFPIQATFMGIHDYDNEFGDQSPEHTEKMIRRVQESIQEAKDINPSKLSEVGKVNRELLLGGLELQLYDFDVIRQHESDADFGGIVGMALFPLFTREFAPIEERMNNIASRLEQLPRAFNEFKRGVKKPIKLWTETALKSTQGMPGFIQLITSVAENQVSEKTLDRLKKAGTIANETITKAVAWLEELAKIPDNDWAIGAEKFEKLLELRKLGLTSNQILELGHKYLKQFKKEIEQLAEQISPGSTVEEVRERLKDDHPDTFEKVLEVYREAVESAKQWVIENEFVTVHEGILKVVETPPFLSPLIPTAALVVPGRFEEKKSAEYLVTRPTEEKNLREHFMARIPNTCIHEAYPGHFNECIGNANAPLSRFFFHSTEMVEGWAFYCEQVTKDMGFNNTPEARFAQTIALLFRAARIIVDVKLSRGEMSFDEAIKTMMDETGMPKEKALAEVTRYTQSPGYPLSYLLGRHQLMEIRKELEEEYGNEFNQRLFHDTIIASGNIPLSYIPKFYRLKAGET